MWRQQERISDARNIMACSEKKRGADNIADSKQQTADRRQQCRHADRNRLNIRIDFSHRRRTPDRKHTGKRQKREERSGVCRNFFWQPS
jgi:transglutaminase-like putative cysteine protease